MPGHVGVPQNERADAVAKAAVGNMIAINGEVPRGDIKMMVKQVSAERWSTAWNRIGENNLREIKEDTKPLLNSTSSSRH